jgi:hypothetical protein
MVVYRPVIGVRNSISITFPSSLLRAKNAGAILPAVCGKPLPYSPHRTVRPNWLLEAAFRSHPKQA